MWDENINIASKVSGLFVAQSCPTLCNPMDCSTPGLPVFHHLSEFAQTHVHWVGDAIQPFCAVSHPSPALNLAQHQGFSSESALSIRWPKYWSFSFSISPSNEYSGLISFRIDCFDLLAVSRVFSMDVFNTCFWEVLSLCTSDILGCIIIQGTVLCIVGCLATSLASTHQRASSPLAVTIKNASRCYYMSPGYRLFPSPPLRTTALKEEQDSKSTED